MDGMSSIRWRDCALASAVELPASELLIYNVEYPEASAEAPDRRCAILFLGFHALEVNELPLPGTTTLLDVEVVASSGGLHTLRIETNNGLRVVSARAVRLAPGWHFHGAAA